MSPLLQDGLNITAIGIGVVFVLLTSLVFIIRGMSALSRVLAGSAPAPSATQTAPATGAPAEEEELIIAISAAIAAARRQRQ